ncbi:MAG: hypothetical protein LCH26_04460 [Proteobacteria bacterium]|nr:hypothetical protein [Pseudomonadota bacterium]
MRTVKPSGALILACLLSASALWSSAHTPQKCDVLFVTYDMADLNALKAVAGAFRPERPAPCFLAFGQARAKMMGDPRLVLTQMGAGEVSAWPRERLLSQEDLDQVNALGPKVVVTGMASALQAQLLGSASHKAFAFYDNFDPIVDAAGNGKEYIQAFLDQSVRAEMPFTYLVPSDATGASFDDDPRTKGKEKVTVGQPVLEEWETLFKDTDKDALRGELGIAPSRRVIVFAGGYDATYEPFFTLFVDTMKDMVDAQNLEVLITYHPKGGGVLERRLVQEAASPHIRVIESEDKGGVATNKLATLASVFMCHKSSLGPQAISQGLPMLYVADPKDYTNLVLEKGLARIAGTKADLRARLEELLQAGQPPVSLAPLGLPEKKAGTEIVRLIEGGLGS